MKHNAFDKKNYLMNVMHVGKVKSHSASQDTVIWLNLCLVIVVFCFLCLDYRLCSTEPVYHCFTVYMEIGNQEGDFAEIEFDFDGVNNNRRWDIKVTQIECSNRGRL